MLKVKEKKNKSSKVAGFPKLMKSRNTGMIILATGAASDQLLSGVVLTDSTSTIGKFKVGVKSDTWMKKAFKDYQGKLILKNE